MTADAPLGPPLPDHIDPRDYAVVIVVQFTGKLSLFYSNATTPTAVAHTLRGLVNTLETEYAAPQPDLEERK